MTYAMTLDNSWEMMSEEEMYDVNGGWTKTTTEYLSGNAARIWIIDKIFILAFKAGGAILSSITAAITTPTGLGVAVGILSTVYFTGSAAFTLSEILLSYDLYTNNGGFWVVNKSLLGIIYSTRLA